MKTSALERARARARVRARVRTWSRGKIQHREHTRLTGMAYDRVITTP